MKAIINASVVTPEAVLQDAVILIEGERIAAVGRNIAIPAGCEIIDAAGKYVGPGFVDIHSHAGGTHPNYLEPVESAAYHLDHGTTSYCATLSYSQPVVDIHLGMDNIRKAMEDNTPGNIAGIHMEGPFINPKHGAGSKNPVVRHKIDMDEARSHVEKAGDLILHWMTAPELDGSAELFEYLKANNIVIDIGHTAASPAQVDLAQKQGAKIVTHLYDAMGCYMGDESVEITGTIQDAVADAALVNDELICEIIPDSLAVHVKPTSLKLAYMVKGADRIVIITDSTARTYNPADYPKEHLRSAIDINFNEAGELSGSALTMDQAFRNFAHYTGAGVVDLFKMAATNAAKVLGLNEVGSVEAGKLANLVILDRAYQLCSVILKGEIVK